QQMSVVIVIPVAGGGHDLEGGAHPDVRRLRPLLIERGCEPHTVLVHVKAVVEWSLLLFRGNTGNWGNSFASLCCVKSLGCEGAVTRGGGALGNMGNSRWPILVVGGVRWCASVVVLLLQGIVFGLCWGHGIPGHLGDGRFQSRTCPASRKPVTHVAPRRIRVETQDNLDGRSNPIEG